MASSSEWEREQRRRQREAEQARRAAERQRTADERAAKQAYLESRVAETDRLNRDIDKQVARLRGMLPAGLESPSPFSLKGLKRRPKPVPFDAAGLDRPVARPRWSEYEPAPPGVLARMFGGRQRYEDEVAAAKTKFASETARAAHEDSIREQNLRQRQLEHDARVRQAADEAKAFNARLDELTELVDARDVTAVEKFVDLCLRSVPLPSRFPRRTEIAFNVRGLQIVIQSQLPDRSCVPDVRSYGFVKTRDEIKQASRSRKEIAELYKGAVSQFGLLQVRAIIRALPWLESVTFNGHVEAINPATGEEEYPCLISVEVPARALPHDDNLRRVQAEECLRHLGAIVSPHPFEQEPIEPILDFDLSKYSFVQGLDAVSTLDARPNLMDMSYTNFEHLVRQIFVAQGAEGWTTTQSNDDGIDAVILNRKSLVGGLAIVQAKQYRTSRKLGPNHLRELAGAMEEKKAGWGILITTSTFTAGCEQKAREHGRMELIDGQRLIWLIKEYLNKDVLIGSPGG